VPVRDKGVVVTGAAGGIGHALAGHMAREGARVVVTDIDEAGLARVAADLGAYAVCSDAATAAGVEHVVTAAREQLGAIDVFFANAGIETGTGLETSDEDWARSLDVNVMAHVRAARLLVPDWLKRGGGRFVVTASAAGLLTMIGSAPYSVTKHAAVAFAEWLSITYGDRGVVVQAICPQGVQTRMYNRAGPLRELLAHDRVVTPDELADVVWEGMQDNRFLVLPHPEVAGYYAQRATDTEAWLAGMRRLQARFEQHHPAASLPASGADHPADDSPDPIPKETP
jgi:NAD(P)-dependent dehydrogenase (short-subunit alcohol dehydrogenase family)